MFLFLLAPLYWCFLRCPLSKSFETVHDICSLCQALHVYASLCRPQQIAMVKEEFLGREVTFPGFE